MKSIIKILVGFSLLTQIVLSNNPINAFEQVDITQYAITKQYDLSQYNLNLNNVNTLSANNVESISNFLCLDNNRDINNDISKILSDILYEHDNSRLEAIGRTTVYFEKVENDELIQYIPITEEQYYNTNLEYSTYATGATKTKGSLSLYTVAYYENDYLYGRSVAVWNSNTGSALSQSYPSLYDDFISLTLPSNYTITSHFADETNTINRVTAYPYDDDISSVIYGYSEWFPQSSASSSWYTNDILIGARGVEDYTSTGTVKIISKYLHTYNSFTPSIDIINNEVSFGTSDKSWQISSFVILS